MMHKKFADSINVVIIRKKNLQNGKQSQIVLFSTDLDLSWECIIDYYNLRYQIEFNFRDAKQHWGLEDFMVVKEQAVINAAYLSMWMVNLSQVMLASSNGNSILDLKTQYHARRYVKEVIKILPQNTKPINIEPLFEKIPMLGLIHQMKRAA